MSYQTEEMRMDESFGFPVVIHDAPKREYDGRWALDVGIEALNRAVLVELVQSPGPWTGAEVTFVRHWLGDTLEEFAERVGVSHPAVIKWEDAEEEPTPMGKGNEYLLRSQVAAELREAGAIDESTFAELLSRAMEFEPEREPAAVEIDGTDLVDDDWGSGEVDVAS